MPNLCRQTLILDLSTAYIYINFVIHSKTVTFCLRLLQGEKPSSRNTIARLIEQILPQNRSYNYVEFSFSNEKYLHCVFDCCLKFIISAGKKIKDLNKPQ